MPFKSWLSLMVQERKSESKILAQRVLMEFGACDKALDAMKQCLSYGTDEEMVTLRLPKALSPESDIRLQRACMEKKR